MQLSNHVLFLDRKSVHKENTLMLLKKLSSGILLFSVLLMSACTTCEAVYDPERPPVYPDAVTRVPVQLKAVNDHRKSTGNRTYYRHVWDTARFDRTVTRIVEEALETEIRRFGLNLVDSNPARFIECNVHDCSATFIQGTWGGNKVNLVLSLKFKIIDPTSGRIEEENTRTATRTIELGSFVPQIMTGGAMIRGFGDSLVNSLLPDVISQELTSNRYFQRLAHSKDIDSTVIDMMTQVLLFDFESNLDDSVPPETRIGVMEIKNDSNGYFRSIVISSFMKYWKSPNYRVFTRDKIDVITSEWKNLVSDSFDDKKDVIGKLKGVDYIVTGGKSIHGAKTRIEIQVIRVTDGEIMASKSKNLKT